MKLMDGMQMFKEEKNSKNELFEVKEVDGKKVIVQKNASKYAHLMAAHNGKKPNAVIAEGYTNGEFFVVDSKHGKRVVQNVGADKQAKYDNLKKSHNQIAAEFYGRTPEGQKYFEELKAKSGKGLSK